MGCLQHIVFIVILYIFYIENKYINKEVINQLVTWFHRKFTHLVGVTIS